MRLWIRKKFCARFPRCAQAPCRGNTTCTVWWRRRSKPRACPAQHEYRLAPRRRIDFFLDGVGVEIKKGRPNARELLKQVERYLACDELKEIIVVTQKDTPLPARVLGKRVTCISLDRLWGVALP